MNKRILILLLLSLITHLGLSQRPQLNTRPSQKAKVFQQIGTTNMEVIYHSPLANGRTIFGGIVPYDLTLNGGPQPWRAGANENTTISFSHDVSINGQALKSGIYGVFVFIQQNEWIFTFSKRSKDWGNFTYDSDEDALRVKIIPKPITDQEWLSYQFRNPQPASVQLALAWGKLEGSIEISTNVDKNILDDIELMETKNWMALYVAAKLSLKKDSSDLKSAMTYIEASMNLQQTFSNREFKSFLLAKSGQKNQSQKLLETALADASPNEIFSYAMSLNNKGELDEALKMLALNLEKNPDHWFAYLGYGNYYRTRKEYEKAAPYFEKALEYAPEQGKGFARYQLGFNKRLVKD